MTLREHFWASVNDPSEGAYERWLEDEARWYRKYADDLAQTLNRVCHQARHSTPTIEEARHLLIEYRDARNLRDFD